MAVIPAQVNRVLPIVKKNYRAILFLLTVSVLFFFPLTPVKNGSSEAAGVTGNESSLFYSYQQLADRLFHIEDISGGVVSLDVIGQSNQGRDIFLASAGTGEIPVMIVTQQHAREPHATQSALHLLEELGTSQDPLVANILEQLTVHIVPRLNPDGAELFPELFWYYNVDPDVPPPDSHSGISGSYRGGWNLNGYHTINWADHALYNYEEFALMADSLGFIPGKTLSGSVHHGGTEGIVIDCGLGLELEEFPEGLEGNIALMERGGPEGASQFWLKAQNARDAGAAGAIVYQYEDGTPMLPTWSLGTGAPDIPVMAVPRDRALEIIESTGPVTAQFITHTYRENPATEAQLFKETVLDIDPLWLIDAHNQFSYISPAGKAVTCSLLWPTNSRACPQAVDISKQVVVAMSDHMEQFQEAEVTLFPGGTSANIARNAYSTVGVAVILMEHWNNYTNPKMVELMIEHAYEQMHAALVATADGSLFEIDPERAELISERGTRTNVAEAERLIEPLMPVSDEEKEAAIQEAVAAIGEIPDPVTIHDVMEVRVARHLVDRILSMGGVEADIPNLDELAASEAALDQLYHDNYMRWSILDLDAPTPENNNSLPAFIRNRADRWWEDGHYINGMSFRPLGSVSISYSLNNPRWAEYDISGRHFTYIKGYAGVADDTNRYDYPVTFQIHGDGDLLYETDLDGGYADFYLVDIEGVESLRIGWSAERVTADGWANKVIVVEPQFLVPVNSNLLTAVAEAVEAVEELPHHISLLDETAVEAARFMVEAAADLGVERERIPNLNKLLSAEEAIAGLYLQYYEQESLFELGAAESANSWWFGRDFNDPDRWDIDTNSGHTIDRVSYAPRKTFYSSYTNLLDNPRWAEWDISQENYSYIEGYAGISDNSVNLGMPVKLIIYGDGETIFSAHLGYGRTAASYRLDLAGVHKLKYLWRPATEHVTDSGSAERPAIVEPRFLYSPRSGEAAAEAIEAISELPSEITLADRDDVEKARARVGNALALGAAETEIDNLSRLIDAEIRIAQLESEDIFYGDVDGNGVINMADVIMLLRHLTGLIDLEQVYGPEALDRARFSAGEGPPDLGDAIMIIRLILDISG